MEESRQALGYLRAFNTTFLTLIPNSKWSNTTSKFRPKALCNFTYKIISKVVANRLKLILPILVGPKQSSFGEGVGSPKCHIFILFFLHYSSHSFLFITSLTIPYTIFKNKYGSPCYFPIYLFLSILREFMIKY